MSPIRLLDFLQPLVAVFETPEESSLAPAAEPTPSPSLIALLGGVAEATTLTAHEKRLQDELVTARLGVAGSLFNALRAKHLPTAQHCLRVALSCSGMSQFLSFGPDAADHLEVAALLHDVGKIGIPDQILAKPIALDANEVDVVRRHRDIGIHILESSATPEVLEIVRLSTLPIDQHPHADDPATKSARILAIADAYDAMTTDRVYRHAMSRERALAELFQHLGTQFDAELARVFASCVSQTRQDLHEFVVKRWRRDLQSNFANELWDLKKPLVGGSIESSPAVLFQQRLLDTMYDGVIFIDSRRRIVLWNRGAERLVGITRESVIEKIWNSAILDLRDQEGNLIRESNCPVDEVIRTGVQTLRRLTITRGGGTRLSVDTHVIPVIDEQHRCFGATVLLHDVSSETNLEKRVQNLHEQATTDPLTGVSNRAEFDRGHRQVVERSLANGESCSIIICDIDHFKKVNDVHGHQAGDEALIAFAELLQRHARPSDLVARYGGEEFILVLPRTDNVVATRLAEDIRAELAQIAQPMLNQKRMTASFGITEIQMGDTPDTMLRRADRALYRAKEAGRNRVELIGVGLMPDHESENSGWKSWLNRRAPDCLLDRKLVASVPMNLLVEKIKGFIVDNDATIVRIEEQEVHLSMMAKSDHSRRQADRPLPLSVELKLEQVSVSPVSTSTMIHVVIRPKRARDRRRRGVELAGRVLSSLKAYLIAQDYRPA